MSTPEQIKKLAFVANGRDDAEAACAQLEAKYGGVPVDEADIIVALGGDGLMLQTLHKCLHTGTPIFGMNYGSIGFLMNPFEEDNLHARIASAKLSVLHPLHMSAFALMAAATRLWLLMRSRFCAKPRKPPNSKFRLMAMCGWKS